MPDRERLTAWLASDFPALLSPWLRGQRWYSAKSRTIRSARVEDVFWLPASDTPAAVVVVCVSYVEQAGSPAEETFAIVVAVASEARGCPRIAHVDLGERLTVVEATSDAAVLHALLQGLATGRDVPGERGGRIVYADATPAARQLLAPGPGLAPTAAPVGGEQSNSSVRVGPSHVFKLFRRLEPGENPQVEVERHLARHAFRQAPSLEGSLAFQPRHGRPCTLGVMENWVDSRGDGWRHVVAEIVRSRTEARALDDLADEIFDLGETTADLHLAMSAGSSDPAFAPEAVTTADLEAWTARARATAIRVAGLAEASRPDWTEECTSLAHVLGDACDRLVSGSLRPRDAGTCSRIRVHGDYHLGQTLKTDTGWMIIDFEGEPARSLAERREKSCALKDVAGMLRSFDYAVEAARQEGGGPYDGAPPRDRLRTAFTDGYLSRSTTTGTAVVPRDPATVAEWIGFFEVEKALYEVEYEINNRPDWVHIPLQGLARLLRGGRP